jgi:hypothetical protein
MAPCDAHVTGREGTRAPPNRASTPGTPSVQKVAAERTVECLDDEATASIACGRVLLHATPRDESSQLVDILPLVLPEFVGGVESYQKAFQAGDRL